MLAEHYGQLPHQIFKECGVTDWNFNIHVLSVALEAKIAARKEAERKGGRG